MSFHMKNGLFIERLANGDVHIWQEKDGHRTMDETFPPNEFASLVCAGSKDQEMYHQWYAAMQLLGVDGYETGWETYQFQKNSN